MLNRRRCGGWRWTRRSEPGRGFRFLPHHLAQAHTRDGAGHASLAELPSALEVNGLDAAPFSLPGPIHGSPVTLCFLTKFHKPSEKNKANMASFP